jgi:MFS family permease
MPIFNSHGFKNVFRSLKYRNYRLFFSGQSISLIGTWIQRIATPWLVYHLTGSVFLLGVVGFAGQIPTFLLSPFAGVYTDRWNKYRILIATQIAAMIQALILAFLCFTGTNEVWQIIALSTALGIINAFDVPARQSLVVDMVDKKGDLGNAIALNSFMFNGARLVGPSVAGLLIAFTGEGGCFLINGISYVFVIACLLFMNVDKSNAKINDSRVVQEFKEGFKYTFGFEPIKYIILLLALVSLMGMQYTVLMPVFAKEILHGGARTFGFLMGASGLGALAGAIYLASRKNAAGLEKIIPVASGIFGLALIVFSFSKLYWLSLVLMVVVGNGMMLQMASSNTILQTIVDDDKRGRVMSFYTMAIMGTAPFGSILAGSLAKTIGTAHTILISGVSCILGAIIYAKKLPQLRKAIRPIYVSLGFIIKETSKGIQMPTKITASSEGHLSR